MEENTQKKSARALTEERILAFWEEHKIFEKAVQKEAPKGDYIFYEGPPTANAKPALHHLEARAFKDVIPRYKTMQGYHVPRRAGWDTHGLPVELQIEKKLGITSKKEIEAYGVAAFNKECKDSVFTFIKDWEKFTERIGYWVDKKSAYYTFDTNYMESLWHIFATVNNKGLVYKDFKVVPWCPRCGTGLSSHELAQPGAYVDVKDLSVYAKFKIIDKDPSNSSGQDTYILAWTTTPWTLPGNVGLAVGSDIEYVKVKCTKKPPLALPSLDTQPPAGFIAQREWVIVAQERFDTLKPFFEENYGSCEIEKTFLGKELLGLEYEPLYPFLSQTISGTEAEKLPNGYKVYAADFVTTTDGTGIVHTAVMYGADDFELGTKVGLPKFHTVDETGHFIKGTDFLEGRFVKDEEVAVDIIKDLAHRGLLFKKEKYEHSYPHCWRCKTPLLYYARDSWYIAMSKLRDALVHENESINWEPAHIKEGRFGEWLKDAKDWAISRERYWGTPLPIWQAPDGERLFVDSVATLKQYMKRSSNTYTVMRHGQTESNVKGLWDFGDSSPLTEEGQKEVLAAAKLIKNIDVIITSPYKRTTETATIVATQLGLNEETIVIDKRIGEWNVGAQFDGKPLDNYFEIRNNYEDRYNFKTEDGESYADILKRTGEFMYELEQKYQGKNILIISHGAVTRAIELLANGMSLKTMFQQTRDHKNLLNGEIREIDFVPLPHNEQYELDLHRPYIDEVVLVKEEQEYRRVKEVMDVWFDSGSMPFAQDHYPFENKEWIDTKGFPADFISEAIDQTRGWFYTLHAVGILMGRGKAYKNVICLGHILDAEGKKMSKSIGNIVDPEIEIARFGVDALRLWMYAVNQPGDSKNYDPKTVMELERQVFGLLYNILSFYELYRDRHVEMQSLNKTDHVLDQWIIARLNGLIAICTDNLDNYKLMEPVRAIRDFINDLSTWWLRRSRDRLKDGEEQAKQTLYHVLKTLSQLLAPFAPFAAEDMWLQLRKDNEAESVHLSNWPSFAEAMAGEASAVNFDDVIVLEKMIEVRGICTVGNALRKRLAIPVRQPLQSITVRGENLSHDYCELIMDELNVKAVAFDSTLDDEAVLDINITPELKAEGDYREFVRAVQDLRKQAGLTPQDSISLTVDPSLEPLLTPFLEDFKKTVLAESVVFAQNDGEKIIVADKEVYVSLK